MESRLNFLRILLRRELQSSDVKCDNSGSAGRHEVPGALPHRAGGGGHAVRGREERPDLFPRLLQALSQKVPRV